MVFPNEASKILIKKFSDLKESEYWEDYVSLEEDYADSLKFTRLMTIFSHYISDILNAAVVEEKNQEIKEAFSLIEFFLNEGDQDVGDVAATCFLENLINYVAWGSLKPESFLPYLGKESKKYCKAWDEFTGTKTEGLWD